MIFAEHAHQELLGDLLAHILGQSVGGGYVAVEAHDLRSVLLLRLEVTTELGLAVACQDAVTLRRDTLTSLLDTPRLVRLSVRADEGLLQLGL